MPPHTHYVEPYFGGGAVLFAKDGEGVSEVVNDVNEELTTFWQCLRNPYAFGALEQTLLMTAFSQNEFENAKELCDALRTYPTDSAVIRATAFFIRYRQSRQGLGKDFATLSRNRVRRGMNEQVSSWLSAVEGLPEAHERLKRVVVLNDDAVKVIKQQDGPKTHFYLDPPYLHETRVTTGDYEHEMTEDQHRQLLAVLDKLKGTFQLSGYRSALYDSAAVACRWHRADFDLPNNASGKKAKERKTECLWMNYEPQTATE